jgi:hypothetical protein
VGDQLLVTIREPLDEPACDPALGFVDGAELLLSVEEFGPSSACNSAIGPFTMEPLDPMYWREAAEDSSGSAAFASTAHTTLGDCAGILGLDLEQDETRTDGELDTFDTLRVIYGSATDDSACPGYCTLRYAVDVERL